MALPVKRAKKAPPSVASALAPHHALSPEIFLIMVLGALLVGFVFLQMPQFQWLGVPFALPSRHLDFFLYLGAALLAVGFWLLPPSDPKANLPRWAAYPILAVIFAVGTWLRFYRIGEPIGYYWDDPAYNIIDPRSVVDLHQFHILFPIGSREPLYPYVLSLVYWIFPDWKGLVAQRVGANLLNLSSIWIFYLLGREVSGKRLVGLLMAALMAVSKPALLQNLCGMGGLSLLFGVGLFLLFQNRVFRKPNLAHFLEWGGALAVGLYTYNAARAWTPFLAFILLGWILWQWRGEKLTWPVRVILFLFALGFMPSYLDKMLFVLHNNPITRIWSGSFSLWLFWQAGFLAALVYGFRVSGEKGRHLCGWALALLLTGILIYPLTTLPDAINRIASISLMPKTASDLFSSKFFDLMTGQLNSAIKAVFIWSEDRPDMNVVGDPFLDYHAAVWIVIGLAALAARPSWMKLFFFACAWVGIIPRIMTIDPQSAKMLGALPSLLLFAALAVGEWLEAAWAVAWKKRWMGILLVAGVAVFWAWEAKGTYLRVFEKWWYVQTDDVCLAKAAEPDILAEKRVYLVGVSGFGYMSPATQGVLHDGEVLYLWRETNVIDVSPDEPRKDVVVFVSPRTAPTVERLKKEFPKAQWSTVWQYYQKPNEGQPFSYRVLIPADQIPEKPGKAFQVQVIPGVSWLRRVYVTGFGLCRGMIQWEDRSPTLNPLSQEAGAHSNSAEGVWEAPADGDYTFSMYTPDVMKLLIDGKKIVDFVSADGYERFSRKAHLTKGVHNVKFLTFLRVNLRFTEVTIKSAAIGYEKVLGN
jgi:hypothetical protein